MDKFFQRNRFDFGTRRSHVPGFPARALYLAITSLLWAIAESWACFMVPVMQQILDSEGWQYPQLWNSPDTCTTFGMYLFPSIAVIIVKPAHAMLCWSLATRIIHVFVVVEKYFTTITRSLRRDWKETHHIRLFRRQRVIAANIPVNDNPTLPHPVSPKFANILCFIDTQIAFVSKATTFVFWSDPELASCARPCLVCWSEESVIGMNSTRIQRFYQIYNRDREDRCDFHGQWRGT